MTSSSWKSRSPFIENFQVGLIDEEPVTFSPGLFSHDATLPQMRQRFRDGRGRDTGLLCCCWNRHGGIALQMLKDPEHRRGRTTESLDLPLMFIEQRDDLASRLRRLFGSLLHAS